MGKLLALSLVISLVGIFALLFLAVNQKPEKITAYSILNSYVRAEGTITSVRAYNEFNILKLDSSITVICFGCKLIAGQKIQVTGTIEDYQGEKQINAEKIKILN